MSTNWLMLFGFLLLLLLLGPKHIHCQDNVTLILEEQEMKSTPHDASSPLRTLSRGKRFVAFPVGSSASGAVCLTTGVIGNPNLLFLSLGINWGVAYDLPNITWVLQNAHGWNTKKPAEAQIKRRHRRELYGRLETMIGRIQVYDQIVEVGDSWDSILSHPCRYFSWLKCTTTANTMSIRLTLVPESAKTTWLITHTAAKKSSQHPKVVVVSHLQEHSTGTATVTASGIPNSLPYSMLRHPNVCGCVRLA